jgi:hypothetical protein
MKIEWSSNEYNFQWHGGDILATIGWKKMLFYIVSRQRLVSTKVTQGIATSKKGNATTSE